MSVADDHADLKTLRLQLDAGTDVDARDEQGFAYKGHLGCVRLLISHKASLEAKSDRGSTAFTYAVQGKYLEIVQVLLDAGANVNNRDRFGWTPLIWAVYYNGPPVVQLLLKRRADANLVITRVSHGYKHETSALDIAKNNKNTAAVQMLESLQQVGWTPGTHSYFCNTEFGRSVVVVLILHHTFVAPAGALLPCHADANNCFWKLPKPLLFRIISFAAPSIKFWLA